MNPWQRPGQPGWGPPPQAGPQHPVPPAGYPPAGYQYPYPHPYPGYQPSYPQPGYQQPYPQSGYPGHSYPAAPRAGGGTAVTAIVLSVILALSQSLAALGYFATSSELSSSGGAREAWVPGFLQFQGAVRLVAAVALFTGAVMLMRRSAAGRCVVAVTSGAIVAVHVLDMAAVSSSQPGPSSTPAGSVAGVLLPIGCLVLALIPSTRRWLADKQLRR